MPTNIEIKARIADLDSIRTLVESLTDARPEVINQEDTFFHVPHGRFKLRAFSSGEGQLIFYERGDVAGPKESQYSIVPLDDAAAMKGLLAQALGLRAVVRKRRTVYIVGQTRVHLDEVEGLGSFVELEVVLEAGQSPGEGRRIAQSLMERLTIPRDALVDRAYVDLLEMASD